MLDELSRQLSRWIQSDALVYILGGLFVVIWWAVSAALGVLRRGQDAPEPRPRRRLPLR